MTEGAPQELPPLGRLGDLMRQAAPPAHWQEHSEGRERFIASVEKTRGPRRKRLTAGALALAGAAALVLTAGARLHRPAAPLGWHVEGGPAGAQGYVSVAPTGAEAKLLFGDGSNVILDRASSMRVTTTRVGAELALEHGRARVHVQHRDSTHWLIDAGPFAVHVTGTDFVVAWSAEAETLQIWMRSGRVEVSGPVPGDGVALTAGKHLRASQRDQTWQIDGQVESMEDSSNAPPQGDGSVSPPSMVSTGLEGSAVSKASIPPSIPPSIPSSNSPSISQKAGWPVLVAEGEYARVVQEAEEMGVERAIVTRPLGDLRALADAARYAGDVTLANRGYASIRSRFGSSPEARTAAFLMGRIEEEQAHSVASALRWYDTYLSESPRGPYSGDALGRKMLLIAKSQGQDAARPFAQQYLRGFPGGPYAAAARDLAP